MTFLPGTRFLIDTSALARARYHGIGETILGLIDQGMACTCITIDLEAGYSARNPDDLKKLRHARREAFIDLPITAEVAERALRVQELLAERGLHRAAGSMDLITAAAAEIHRATILHYDADFEHIASVTGQAHQWIAPRGSID